MSRTRKELEVDARRFVEQTYTEIRPRITKKALDQAARKIAKALHKTLKSMEG